MGHDWYDLLLFLLLGALAMILLERLWSAASRAARSRRGSHAKFHQSAPRETLQLDERPRTVPEAYWRWMNLTEREREVARLAVQGKSSRRIGEELMISENTVENHRKHIYHKLNISSAHELKQIAQDIVEYEGRLP